MIPASVSLTPRLDLMQQEFFNVVAAGDINRVHEMANSLRGTGTFPPRLNLLTVKNEKGQTVVDVALSLADDSPAHKAIYEFLSRQRLQMEYFE